VASRSWAVRRSAMRVSTSAAAGAFPSVVLPSFSLTNPSLRRFRVSTRPSEHLELIG
jgi:hypothetical protein